MYEYIYMRRRAHSSEHKHARLNIRTYVHVYIHRLSKEAEGMNSGLFVK